MKKLLFLILAMHSLFLVGQENLSKENIVSNDSNYDLSPFKTIYLNKKKVKNIIELNLSSVTLGKYYNEYVAKILDVDKYKLNTALEFQLERDSLHYYYPIDFRTFNWKHFEKNIFKKNGVQKVKLCVTIYSINSTHIVIVNRIKKIKNNN